MVHNPDTYINRNKNNVMIMDSLLHVKAVVTSKTLQCVHGHINTHTHTPAKLTCFDRIFQGQVKDSGEARIRWTTLHICALFFKPHYCRVDVIAPVATSSCAHHNLHPNLTQNPHAVP